MKHLISIFLFFVLASCSLLYNPDFADKVISTDNKTTSAGISGGGADGTITPGDALLSGNIDGAVKAVSVVFTVDGGTEQTGEISGRTWKARLAISTPGPHTVQVKIKDAAGNENVNKFSLQVPLYVTTNGNDLNAGTSPSWAFAGIQAALDKAQGINPAIVYIEYGIYSPAAQITNFNSVNLSIIGGWNSDFSKQNGYSTISGANNKRCLYISNSTGLKLQNLAIMNGSAPAGHGGGLLLQNVRSSRIEFLDNRFNTAISGGAVACESCSDITLNTVDCFDNTAISNGGAFYITNSTGITLSGDCISNTVTGGSGNGGGIALFNCRDLQINASVITNRGSATPSFGGGLYMNGVQNAVIANRINLNSAYVGAGIYITGSYNSVNTISADIVSNSAYNGGGIRMEAYSYSSNNVISGNVIENSGVTGGGISICPGTGNNNGELIIAANILYNKAASGTGAGVQNIGGNNITLRGLIQSNQCNGDGAGVYASYSTNFTISADIIDNIATNGGGGIFLSNSVNTTLSGNIVENASGKPGGAIFSCASSNLLIYNSIISNNYSGQSNISILLYDMVNGNMNNIIISNNTFSGGGTGNTYAIYHGAYPVGVYRLYNNRFITNNLVYLHYYSTAPGFYITTSNTSAGSYYSWSGINTSGYLGGIAGGNSVLP